MYLPVFYQTDYQVFFFQTNKSIYELYISTVIHVYTRYIYGVFKLGKWDVKWKIYCSKTLLIGC